MKYGVVVTNAPATHSRMIGKVVGDRGCNWRNKNLRADSPIDLLEDIEEAREVNTSFEFEIKMLDENGNSI